MSTRVGRAFRKVISQSLKKLVDSKFNLINNRMDLALSSMPIGKKSFKPSRNEPNANDDYNRVRAAGLWSLNLDARVT